MRDFCDRHGLAVCAAELCSVGRITGFNRMQCQKCFKTLRDSCEENILEIPEELQIRQHKKGILRVLGPVPLSSATSNATTATLFLFRRSLLLNDRGAQLVCSKFIRNQKMTEQYNEETLRENLIVSSPYKNRWRERIRI